MINTSSVRKVLGHSWLGFVQLAGVPVETEKQKSTCTRVVMYRCNKCDELHDWEDAAEECCATEVTASPDADASNCPICAQEWSAHRDAAD